jgi:hypothetical protein
MKSGVFWDVTSCGDISEELSASIISVTKIGELGTLSDSCYPDDGGAKCLRNVGSYKSHTA